MTSRLHRDTADQIAAVPPIHDGMEGEPMANDAGTECPPRDHPKPVLLADPNYCPGTYSLDLYCKYSNPAHGFDEFPHGYVEWQTYGEAAKRARKAGWILHRDGTGTCPNSRCPTCPRSMTRLSITREPQDEGSPT